MDDVERKMLAQFDDDFAGARANALELLREHMKKKTPPRFFRDIAREDEDAAAKIAALEAQYIQAQQINAQAQAAYTKLANDYATLCRRLSVLLWCRTYAHYLASAVVFPLLAVLVWVCIPDETTAHRTAVNDGFTALAEQTPWQPRGSVSNPVVRIADGQPYWVAAQFDANAKHYDANGQPVMVQCVHLFAAPAVADAGVYLKPSPYSLFGFGWLTWPERGVSCKPASAARVAAAEVPAAASGAADGAMVPPRATSKLQTADDGPPALSPASDPAESPRPVAIPSAMESRPVTARPDTAVSPTTDNGALISRVELDALLKQRDDLSRHLKDALDDATDSRAGYNDLKAQRDDLNRKLEIAAQALEDTATQRDNLVRRLSPRSSLNKVMLQDFVHPAPQCTDAMLSKQRSDIASHLCESTCLGLSWCDHLMAKN